MKSTSPIVITGFMGCGKTEVARYLADCLGRPLVDLDETITRREAKSPARLISEDGEQFFRTKETNALETVLKNNETAVIALGGGAWIQDENQALIGAFHGTSVWLDVPFEVCWRRIAASREDRPLGKSRVEALQLYERRLPTYQKATHHFE